MKNFLKKLVVALLPDRCAYCGRIIPSDSLMCLECERSLPRIEGVTCPKCGREKDKCNCKGSEKYFSSLAAPFYYEGCVRKGMHSFKFRKAFRNHKAYAAEMAETVSEKFGNVTFDYITEIPMTDKSIKQRGYNQCFWLSKEIGEILSLEHKPEVLRKIYDTQKQHGMTYHFRKGNVTGAFDVSDESLVKDKTVLLCDDVSTSGETFNECAKMLWLYGAKEIYCISTALTLPKINK